MSDPNQPYGAGRPPPFPPPGPPPTGPLGGPPAGPPFPPPPAPPAGRDQGTGLWIALAVIGMLALAGVVTVLVLLLTGDDDSSGSDPSSSEAAATSTSTTGTEGGSSTATTEPTADSPTGPTLTVDPTDPPSTPGEPQGTSTADQVANEPAAVVEAFIASVLAGDCATAEDLVTEEYLQEEGGGCEAGEVPPSLADQIDYTVGDARVRAAGGTATVPVTVTAFGDTEKTVIELQEVDGRWLISGDDES